MAIRKYLVAGMIAFQVLGSSKGFCVDAMPTDGHAAQSGVVNFSGLESKLIQARQTISKSIEGRTVWESKNVDESYIDRPIELAKFDDEMYEYPNPDSCKAQKDKDVIRQLATLLIYYRYPESHRPDYYIKNHTIEELKQSRTLPLLMGLLANRRLRIKLLIGEMIAYHDKITSVSSWQTIFDNAVDVSYDNGTWFHNNGFPANESVCRNKRYPTWGNNREVMVDPEGWLYSFWLRRYKAGTDEITLKLLRVISSKLDG